MSFSRREFVKTAGIALGATAVLPSWVYDAHAAGEALFHVNKDALADAALATAKRLGASYADIRINRYRLEAVNTRERQVLNVSSGQNFGFGVRVLVNGTWGFAASPLVTAEEVQRVTAEAISIAKANAPYQKKKIELVSTPKVVATWKTPTERDPFDVPADEKIATLLKINEAALGVAGVNFVNSSMAWVNEQKYLATSDGSRIEQYLIRGNPSFSATAVNRASGDFQAVNSLREAQSIGYEYMSKHDWAAEAKTAAEHAVMKLKAPSVTPGKYDLVLHPSHLFLTIHESVGHPTELDRTLLWEANYAGTSFLTPDKTGKLQFGSKIVNFVADRTQKLGLATVGWDDEAVPGQEWHIVKDGVFVDWQTTRDLAKVVGRDKSYGCLHADSWGSVPFPRMPNVSLTPAKEKVSQDDLIAGVENGILIYGRGSYSIDQQRYNFQFGGQTFWEIKNGKVAGMLRDVAYQSRTTDFWGACDGLGGQSTYEIPGSFNDGKGEPGQSNAVSHGCPPARFRNINVLNTASSPSARTDGGRPLEERGRHCPRVVSVTGGRRRPRSIGGRSKLMLLTEQETKSLTEKILSYVKADDASASVGSDKLSHLRFAGNNILTSGTRVSRSANVTVWVGGKRGAASTNDLDDANLKDMVERAQKIAATAPVDREYVPTLGKQDYKPVNGFVESTANLSLSARAKSIGAIISECEKKGVIGAGFHSARVQAGGSLTKNGNFEYERSTNVSLSTTARTPDGQSSGYFLRSHFDIAKLDTQRIANEAIRKAIEGKGAKTIDPGMYTVILEPQAVADLMGNLGFMFNARNAEEGRSVFSLPGGKTKLGEKMFDEKVTIYSDPWNAELPGSQSAQGGIPAQRITMVKNGVVENLTYNRFWAKQKGKEPTPGPVNTIFETSGPTSSIDDMIKSTERGILVGRFWYIRSTDQRTASSTGLTRDGVWLIENGKITSPLRNFRFNQSVTQMLGPGNVLMVGKSERVGGSEGGGSSASLLPALKLKAFNFTSQSEAV